MKAIDMKHYRCFNPLRVWISLNNSMLRVSNYVQENGFLGKCDKSCDVLVICPPFF